MALFQMLNVGFSNIVMANRIIAVINSDSASGKRLRDEAKSEARLVDATHGRKTRAIIITDSNHVILSCIRAESLLKRLEANDNTIASGEEDEG